MTEPMRKPETLRRVAALETAVAAGALLAARRSRPAALAIAGLGLVAARGAFGRNSPVFGRDGILVFRDAAHVRDQLDRTERAVTAIAGPDTMSHLFRAPHGFRGPLTSRAAARAGYRTVGWTTGVFDSAQPGTDVIVDRVTRALRPGGIILLHDADGWNPSASRSQTAAALPAICERARALGLEPSSLNAVLSP